MPRYAAGPDNRAVLNEDLPGARAAGGSSDDSLPVVLSLLAAYGLGIGRVRGRFFVLSLALVAFAMPQEALIYPIYYMMQPLGLYDTQLGVVVVLSAAFGTYMLTSVLSEFPREILEAAEIDGAGRFRTLISVVIPVVRPSLAVLAIFFFIWTWNDFFVSLICQEIGRRNPQCGHWSNPPSDGPTECTQPRPGAHDA